MVATGWPNRVLLMGDSRSLPLRLGLDELGRVHEPPLSPRSRGRLTTTENGGLNPGRPASRGELSGAERLDSVDPLGSQTARVCGSIVVSNGVARPTTSHQRADDILGRAQCEPLRHRWALHCRAPRLLRGDPGRAHLERDLTPLERGGDPRLARRGSRLRARWGSTTLRPDRHERHTNTFHLALGFAGLDILGAHRPGSRRAPARRTGSPRTTVPRQRGRPVTHELLGTGFGDKSGVPQGCSGSLKESAGRKDELA